MRKNIITVIAAVLALCSCEEFQPVFTCTYDNPEPEKIYKESEIKGTKVTIAALKAMYTGSPIEISDDIFIAGKVTTNDFKGNFYRSFFIQDETSGIELKIGRYNLYNEYQEGQTVYVRCKGLTLGAYKGMVGIGYRVEESGSSYETAYIEVQYIVDRCVYKGEKGEKVTPKVITASELADNVGCLVTLGGMSYTHHIFFMGYVDANGDKKAYGINTFFCDEEGTWEVPTWAMSADKYWEYLNKGTFDAAEVSQQKDTVIIRIVEGKEVRKDSTMVFNTVGEARPHIKFSKVAYSISQYFTFGGKNVQVRTSGYSKFADEDLDPSHPSAYQDILKGKTVTMTGVLSTYNGEYQFTINDLDNDFKVD